MQANAVQVLAGSVAIPNTHALLFQHTGISASADEPEQLLCHTCPSDVPFAQMLTCLTRDALAHRTRVEWVMLGASTGCMYAAQV